MSKDSQDIQGHLNVSQNTVIGGDLELNGNACIDHDLNVKGWFEARNFRGAMKGLYATIDDLRRRYPCPLPGWYAVVGDTIPGDVYRSEAGQWIPTGGKGGGMSLYIDGSIADRLTIIAGMSDEDRQWVLTLLDALEGDGDVSCPSADIAKKADKSTTISAGTGLTGGGDLSADRTLSLAESGVTAGTYTKLTVDVYGRVTSGATLSATDIPTLPISKITGLQTALDGKLDKTTFNDLFEKVSLGNGEYAIKAKYGFYSVGGVSALGNGNVSGSGGGGSYGLMKAWPSADPGTNTTDALAANLGYDLHTRVKSLEGGSALSVTTTGTGNAVTAIAKSGTAITVTKGATFLTSHQSLADYLKKTDAATLYQPKGTYLTKHQDISHLLSKTDADAKFALRTITISAGTGLTGGGNLTANRTLSLATSGVTAGTYTKVTVDTYGRVTSGATLSATDIPTLPISKITGLQTALDGKLDKTTFNDLFEKVSLGNGEYAIKAKYGFYSVGGVSALGNGNVSGSGGGGSYGLMKAWPSADPGTNTTDALAANLGYDLHTRVKSLEGGSALSVTTTGTGNAVTAIAKSGTAITVTKGATFLTSHQSLDHINSLGRLTAQSGTTKGTPGLRMYEVYNNGYPVTYGNLIKVQGGVSNGGGELLLGWMATNTDIGRVLYRSQRDGTANSWTPWKTVAWTSDIPTSMAWSAITSKPTTLSGYGITDAYTKTQADSKDKVLPQTGETTGTTLADFNTDGTRVYQSTADKGDGISYQAILSVSAGSSHRYFQIIGGKGNTSLRWRNMNGNGTALADVRTLLDNINYSVILDGRYYTESEINTKLTNGSVTKVGTATVGSRTKPMYLNAGIPTASTATVGAANRPVYLNGGTITAGTYTFGNANGNAPISNGTVNTNLNADMLDGIHAANFAYVTNVINFLSGSAKANITTAKFIEKLTALEAFNRRQWSVKCSWSYANNDIITDSGLGNIQLAGATIETFCEGTNRMIRVTTSPKATDNGVANAVFIYRDHGSSFAPNWKRLANTTDNVASASKLQTARTLWGQSFDGTANVTGNLTSVGNITGSAAMTIKANGALTLHSTANIALKANNDDTKSVILTADAFKPYDAATTKLTLGRATARWATLYATGGNFTGEVVSTSANAFRAKYGSYGFFIRQYGANTYFMLTAKDDAGGTYNALRPFRINNESGNVYIGNSALYVVHGGNVGVGTTSPSYKLHVSGTLGVTGLITASASGIKIGDATISWDSANNALKVDRNFYSTGGVSALGSGSASGSGGSSFGLMRAWGTSAPPSTTNDALGANLGYDLHTRVKSLEGGSALSVTTTGTGNAVTAIAKSGTAITVTKGATFLTSHQSLDHINSLGRLTAQSGTTKGTPGLRMYEVYNNGYPVTYGNLIKVQGGVSNGGGELLLGWMATNTDIGRVLYRSQRDGTANSWTPWKTVAWTSDIPTSMAWSAITSKPTTLSGYGITDAYTKTQADSKDKVLPQTGETTGTTLADFNTDGTRVYQSTADKGDGISYQAILSVSAGSSHRYFQIIGGKGNTSLRWRNMNGNGTALADVRTLLDNINYSVILDGRYYTESEINTKLTNGSVTKVGTATVGSRTKPMYLNAGIPTASTATVGAANRPVYLNGGTITAGTYTFGNANGNAPISNGTVNTNLNADMLDGIHAANFAYVTNVINFLSGSAKANITTAKFIEKLTALEAFNRRQWSVKCSWSYANNDIITDSGLGNIQLAGATIETFCEGTNRMIRVTTSPKATDNGVANAVFIYRDHGSSFAPNWKRLANTTDNVASASKLQTARTLWGQSFDGTANVTGNLTSVGNITGSAAMTIKANGALTLHSTANIALKANNDDTKSVILTADAFKPYDAATTKLTLGRATARWATLYATGGNFTAPLTINYTTETGINLYRRKAGGGAFIRFYNANQTTNFYRIGMYGDGKYGIGYNGTDAITILTGGNVGIGQSAPTTKLDVNGAIHANGWIGTTGNVGWKSDTHGGGIYMADATWVRTYNGKAFYTAGGTIRSDGRLQCGANSEFSVDKDGNLSSTKLAVRTNTGTGDGISLYNGVNNIQSYGILFGKTATFGTHGGITGDWATYFTMDGGTNAAKRGWIFRHKTGGNVASISHTGDGRFFGKVFASFMQVGSGGGITQYPDDKTGSTYWYGLTFAADNYVHLNGYKGIKFRTASITAEITQSGGFVCSGGVTCLSDMRHKTVVSQLSLRLDDIAKAPSFRHVWNDRPDRGIHVGSSAQYWQRILPQVVEGGDSLSLDYGKAALLSVISVGKETLDLKGRVAALERENRKLKELISTGNL